MAFRTFQLKENRAFRVVIQGLYSTTPGKFIIEELKGLGHITTRSHFKITGSKWSTPCTRLTGPEVGLQLSWGYSYRAGYCTRRWSRCNWTGCNAPGFSCWHIRAKFVSRQYTCRGVTQLAIPNCHRSWKIWVRNFLLAETSTPSIHGGIQDRQPQGKRSAEVR